MKQINTHVVFFTDSLSSNNFYCSFTNQSNLQTETVTVTCFQHQ